MHLIDKRNIIDRVHIIKYKEKKGKQFQPISRECRWAMPAIACCKMSLAKSGTFGLYLPSIKSCTVAAHSSNAIYRNWESASWEIFKRGVEV